MDAKEFCDDLSMLLGDMPLDVYTREAIEWRLDAYAATKVRNLAAGYRYSDCRSILRNLAADLEDGAL
jgi:hypothetical protein